MPWSSFPPPLPPHPFRRVFITHCGMHGVMESVYYGVPMVGMAIYGDQADNLARVEDRGVGVAIGKADTADQIQAAILRVRDDQR